MALADDLRAIADRARRELDAAHDYFEHSRFVWRSFQTSVAGGLKGVTENQATGSRLDQDDLVRLIPVYSRKYLVNETYLRKAGTTARYQVGDHVEIDDDYHLDCWRLVKKVVADVTAAAIARLA